MAFDKAGGILDDYKQQGKIIQEGLITSSALLGVLYLLVADTLVITSQFGEIPIGILSALEGTTVLAYCCIPEIFLVNEAKILNIEKLNIHIQ